MTMISRFIFNIKHWELIFKAVNIFMKLFLNKQHKNIKFTVELKTSIPFLDTRVKRRHDLKLYALYHKKTFTGTFLIILE